MGMTTKTMNKKKRFEIVSSWDDGSEYAPKIAKLLKDNGIQGVFFIVVDWIGKPGYMNWDQVKELDKDPLFEIGSHTLTHPQDLKKLFDEELHVEVQNSKDLIESVLGHNISKFCYPRGRADERVKKAVAEAGYIEARGTGRPGIISSEDKLYLPGSIHIFNREEYKGKSIVSFGMAVLDNLKKEGGYCNIWGHGKEIQENGLWKDLRRVLEYAKKVKLK